MYMTHFQKQKGLIGLYLAIVVLVLMIGMIASIGFGVLTQQKIIQNMTQSAQSYYAAESGVEDVLIRLVNGQNVCNPPGSPPCSNALQVANASTATTISGIVGGARTITGQGDSLNRIRKTRITYAIDSAKPGFAFGVQVGDLGLEMGNNATVDGNVYSNGNISGGGVGTAVITGTAKAAGASLVKDITINQDAYAGSFDNCSIGGVAYYVISFTANCTAAGGTFVLGTPVPAEPFPISNAQITDWKNDAAAGVTLASFNIPNNSSATLGPKKITGDLTMGNSATLTLTGTVWVGGTINFGNNATIKLHTSYETLSGVLLVDGPVDTGNSAVFLGSGQAGSYLLLIGLFGPGDAIDLGNTAAGAIFYAPNGIIGIGNNLSLKQATGKGLKTGNDTTLIYETGLADAVFVSGPSGGWTVTSWKEIE